MPRCLGCMEVLQEGQDTCPHCGYKVGTKSVEVFHLQSGTILANKYLVGKAVGYGGFGVTYIGYDTVLERKVAIKEYLPGEFATRVPGQEQLTIYEGEKREQFDSGIEKFLDEARRLGKFDHADGIVHIYDSFLANATAYIVMEYIDGITLKEKISREGKLSLEESVKIILPIAKALEEVHKENILHRDIAPDNIMIGNDGKVRLIDFGASRFATTTYSKSLSVLIKAGYAPVEQYQSRGKQGTWSDVYSLAATFYTMLTGVLPQEAIDRTSNDQLKPPSKMGAKVPKNIDTVILNAMNLKAEERTQTMGQFREELLSQKEVERLKESRDKDDSGKWPLWVKASLGTMCALVIGFLILLGTGVLSGNGQSWGDGIVKDNQVIPNFVNMRYESAYEYAEERNITTKRVPGENDEQITEGAVLSQSIAAGTQIAVGQIVELKVSLGKKMVEMPKLTSKSLEDAKQELAALGFSLEDGSLVIEYVEGFVKDQILQQEPKEMENIALNGSVIQLKVSDGSVKVDETIEVEVPSLEGLDVEEAKELLQGLLLLADDNSLGYSLEYPVANQVVRQEINAGEKVPQGTTIRFEYSLGDTRAVPSVTDLMKDEAIKRLEEAQFAYKVQEEYADAEVGLVIGQNPAKNTKKQIQSTVVLTVSKGPDPNKITAVATAEPTGSSAAVVSTPEPKLSGWEENLPPGVTAVETKQQYRYREKQTIVAENSPGDGWERAGEPILSGYTTWSNWSEWHDSGADTKQWETGYSYRDKTTTKDEYWSEWSEWQDEEIIAQDENDQVETRMVDDLSNPIYKTQYQYDRWKSSKKNSNGNWVFGPTQGTWGGMKCDNHETSEWMDAPLTVTGHQSSQQAGDFDIYEGPWFNQTTKQVETGAYNQKTQYRSRFWMVWYHESWSSWSEYKTDNPSTSSDTREVRIGYRYREPIYSYKYEKWGNWSGWSDNPVNSTSDKQVETRTLYRYYK